MIHNLCVEALVDSHTMAAIKTRLLDVLMREVRW